MVPRMTREPDGRANGPMTGLRGKVKIVGRCGRPDLSVSVPASTIHPAASGCKSPGPVEQDPSQAGWSAASAGCGGSQVVRRPAGPGEDQELISPLIGIRG